MSANHLNRMVLLSASICAFNLMLVACGAESHDMRGSNGHKNTAANVGMIDKNGASQNSPKGEVPSQNDVDCSHPELMSKDMIDAIDKGSIENPCPIDTPNQNQNDQYSKENPTTYPNQSMCPDGALKCKIVITKSIPVGGTCPNRQNQPTPKPTTTTTIKSEPMIKGQ